MRQYPFRYVGPAIGQTIWFVMSEGGNPKVFEGKIGEIADYAEIARSQGNFKEPVENYLVNYWIESPHYTFGNACTFGDDIYETREEAEEAARIWQAENDLILDLIDRLAGDPAPCGQDQLDMAKVLNNVPLNAIFDGYDPETGWVRWSTPEWRDWDRRQHEYFNQHGDLPDEVPPEDGAGEHPCFLSDLQGITQHLRMGGWIVESPTESYFEAKLTFGPLASPYKGSSTRSAAMALCKAILAHEADYIS